MCKWTWCKGTFSNWVRPNVRQLRTAADTDQTDRLVLLVFTGFQLDSSLHFHSLENRWAKVCKERTSQNVWELGAWEGVHCKQVEMEGTCLVEICTVSVFVTVFSTCSLCRTTFSSCFILIQAHFSDSSPESFTHLPHF